MKNNLFLLASVLLLTGLFNQCYGQSVIPHAVPEEYASAQYVVSVNGQPVPVFHAGLNVYFASFDFTGTADVKVTAGRISGVRSIEEKYAGQVFYEYRNPVEAAEFWEESARVRPVSKKVISKTNGAEVTFSLTEAGQYSIERPGTSNYRDQVLFLFANRPEKVKAKPGDPNVIYLEPGIHCRNIDLISGQTLYLEAGAVLFGAVNIWDSKDVHIKGRGVILYYGPQSEDKAPIGWGYQKKMGNDLKFWYALNTRNVEGLTVEGITLIGRSRTFMVNMITTFDAVFDNIKILAVNQANVNGDGFDWFGGGRTIIRNSVVRSQDDCFAFYIASHDKNNSDAVKKSMEVRDIQIENCVLWSTIANVYRVGHGGQELITDNISMKNCDVIHIGRGEWLAPWAIICTVNPYSQGKPVHSNYLFENVRFEEATAFLGLQNEEARYSNIIFRNITMNGNPVPSMVKSQVDGLIFDNVKVNGELITAKVNVPFGQVTKEIENLVFRH